MKFSERDLQVAAAVQFRRDESITALAKRLGLQTHQIQYTLTRLQSLKIIRPWVFINPFALGLEEYELLFTIGSATKRVKSSFDAFLRSHPKVVWFGVLGGGFQYGVRLAVRRSEECSRFLDEIRQSFGDILLRKSFAVLLQFESFPKRYLAPQRAKILAPGVIISPPQSTVKADQTDLKIISVMLANPAASDRELSRLTGYARATVSARLTALRKSGVILSNAYLISASRLGMQSFKALVHGKGLQPLMKTKIKQFASTHESVVNLTTCLGEWDYELGIEVFESLKASELVSELYEFCGDLITHIELLPVFEQNVSERFTLISVGT